MGRRAATVAAVAAWAGLVHGQTPTFTPGGTPAPAATQSSTGSVVTLRTTGQPDRNDQDGKGGKGPVLLNRHQRHPCRAPRTAFSEW